MFRIQKSRAPFGSLLLLLAAFLLSGLPLAAAPLPNADGDLFPDENDPDPLLANLPFHWSVHSIAFRAREGAAGTNLFQSPLYEARAPEALALPSRLTVAPVFSDVRGGDDLSALSGLFGDGTVPWGRNERLAAARAAAALDACGRAGTADLCFVIHLTNLGAGHLRLVNVSVPVLVDGKAVGVARPVDPQARERGFLLPGDGKTYMLAFSAGTTVPVARTLLETLARDEASPDFAVIRAKGLEVRPEAGGAFSLDEVFETIADKTSPVRVEGLSGRSWLWRVAKRRPDGRETALADWADEVNRAMGPRKGPVARFSEDGLLLSLAGWDSGNWDHWWRASVRGRDLPGLDWRSQRSSRGILLSLRDAPPALSSGDRRRYFSRELLPVPYSTLYGITLWKEGDREGGCRYLREAAAAGSAQAHSWLGYILGTDGDSSTNRFLSAMSYKRAADMGYAPGETWYGNCLLRGVGVKADPQAALGYLKRASDQRFPEAQALYGLCMLRGVGMKADPAAALSLLTDAASRGNQTAQLGIGAYLCQRGDLDGMEWIRLAASGGNVRAQLLLADIHRTGKFGARRDQGQAVEWYAAAAAQGDARALVALGEAYRGGDGVRPDPRMAARCFRRAAEAGDRQGQTWYALCLLDGQGVRQDPAEAVSWLGKAAGRGYPEAQYLLGLCLYGGFGGTPRDKEAAVRWFQAASPAQVQARIFLGCCYFTGDGVAQDKARAVRLFADAAKEGAVAAQLWLSYCLANGEGVTMDWKQARKWAQAAADQGSPAGRTMLDRLPRE